jgi:hypothetical protein
MSGGFEVLPEVILCPKFGNFSGINPPLSAPFIESVVPKLNVPVVLFGHVDIARGDPPANSRNFFEIVLNVMGDAVFAPLTDVNLPAIAMAIGYVFPLSCGPFQCRLLSIKM